MNCVSEPTCLWSADTHLWKSRNDQNFIFQLPIIFFSLGAALFYFGSRFSKIGRPAPKIRWLYIWYKYWFCWNFRIFQYIHINISYNLSPGFIIHLLHVWGFGFAQFFLLYFQSYHLYVETVAERRILFPPILDLHHLFQLVDRHHISWGCAVQPSQWFLINLLPKLVLVRAVSDWFIGNWEGWMFHCLC